MWKFLRHIAGFKKGNTPTDERLTAIETDVKWLIRGGWVIFAAVLIRPFLE